MTNLRKGEYFVLKNMFAFLLKIAQAHLRVPKKCEQLEVANSPGWLAGSPPALRWEACGVKGLPGLSEPLEEGAGWAAHPRVLGFCLWADGLQRRRRVPEGGRFLHRRRIWEGLGRGFSTACPLPCDERRGAQSQCFHCFFSLNTKGN